MKKLIVLLAVLVMTGAVQADIISDINPADTWNGYVNAFELDGTTYATGWVESAVGTMSANWSGADLTVSGNTRLYDENLTNPYWVNPDGSPNKIVEGNYYREWGGGALSGQNVTFNFQVLENSTPAGFTAEAFIKTLNAGGDWSTTQFVTEALTVGSHSFNVDIDVLPGCAVQTGFYFKGTLLSASDPLAGLGVTVTAIPEPMTIGLLGLGGLFLRRRK